MVRGLWVFAAAALLVGWLTQLHRRRADRSGSEAALRAQTTMDRILAAHGFPFRVYGLRPPKTDPRFLFASINTALDTERDLLRDNQVLLQELRQALLRAGYPVSSVPLVNFSIESQETVDRDFGGNWYYAKK